jgi:hypothetical protein
MWASPSRVLQRKRECRVINEESAEFLFPPFWILEGCAAGEPSRAAAPGRGLQSVLDGFINAQEGVRPVASSGTSEALQLAIHAIVEFWVDHRDSYTSFYGGRKSGEHGLSCVEPASGRFVDRLRDVAWFDGPRLRLQARDPERRDLRVEEFRVGR